MVSIMEIMQLCRLCLVKEQVNIPIFEEQDDVRQICLKITSCLPVKITKEDKLPKKICDGCLYKLELLYQFYNTTANAEKQLLTWIEQINMDANEKNLENLAAQSTPPTVKQEKLEPVESTNENPDMSAEAQNYMLDQETFQPDFTFKESQGSTADAVDAAENSDEPLAKRPRRGRPRQATKPIPPESLDSSDNDNDNDDAGDSMLEMTVTKTEEESESEGEENVDDPEPTKFEAVGEDTEQPGPSGLGKGGADGPCLKVEDVKYTTGNVPRADLRCDICSKLFGSKYSLRRHKINTHAKLVCPYSCEKCGKRFRKQENLAKHQTPIGVVGNSIRCSEDVSYECEVCKQIFKWAPHLEKHKKEVHKFAEQPVSCPLCDKRLRSKSLLSRHMTAMHPKSINLKCGDCDKVFRYSYQLRKHKSVAHDGQRYTCDICQRSFSCKARCRNHRKTHQPDYVREYPCSTCFKVLSTRAGLKRHAKLHTNDKPALVCDVCGKVYSTNQSLIYHKRQHTGEKPYSCHMCGKRFSRKQYLGDHFLTHTKEKPHTCEICGKGFSQRTSLKIHLRYHSGEKPYECEICQRRFISKGLLSMHSKVHGTQI